MSEHSMDEPDLEIALARFVWAFEQVFRNDWSYSQASICGAGFISDDGTFLDPKVDDEFDDWGYRGLLLRSYRELLAAMTHHGVRPTKPPLQS